MTSEDVIHSFYLPAFRIKKDVLPGRYTSEWFRATRTGTYHLFCAEYCGTNHSGMIGRVVVMSDTDYSTWLVGGTPGQTPEAEGQQLFGRLGCATCHLASGTGRCPTLVGVFGSTVKLTNGDSVTADESYVRESIVNPSAKVVAGYQPIMPSFTGQVSEEQLVALISYIKSLSSPAKGGQP
jgi:cytochrome c oxidase subunit 2